MRLLLELLVVTALIALGWEKSFHQSLGQVPLIGHYLAPADSDGSKTSIRARKAQPVSAAATPSGAWMWDPKRRSVLDRPSPTPPLSFTGHIYYTDENGKKYWLDTQGKRHYDG